MQHILGLDSRAGTENDSKKKDTRDNDGKRKKGYENDGKKRKATRMTAGGDYRGRVSRLTGCGVVAVVFFAALPPS